MFSIGFFNVMIEICPSIICADYLNIEDELKDLNNNGINTIHIDVMDGVFVPQITIGQGFIEKCRKNTKMFFDLHLMIVEPDKQIESFVKSGADSITFHYEATNKHIEILKKIRDFNIKCGIVLQPDTNIELLKQIFEKIIPDKVLIMSVIAGKSGQKFIDSSVEKVKNLDNFLKKENLRDKVKIQIDGGINLETAKLIKDYVDEIVVGSALFSKQGKERRVFIEQLKNTCKQ